MGASHGPVARSDCAMYVDGPPVTTPPDVASRIDPPRSVFALFALMLIGSACGGGGEPSEPGTDAGAESTTAGGALSGAAAELFDTHFGQVCRDTGQPRAAEYVAGPGTHPLLVLSSDDGAEYHQGSATLPDGWSAVFPDLERTELVACVRRVSAVRGEVCEGYSDEDSGQEWTVQNHDVVYDYSVRVARTAAVLGHTTFEVPAGPCPMFSMHREGEPQPQAYYPTVGDGEVELFVRPFVTGG